MRAIAIETSGRVGSIAICENGAVLQEQTFAHGLLNAAQILPILDSLCRAQRWAPQDIAELYLSIGPGSFTGLRIAVTLAKMLAFAHGTKLIAVPSPRVLVENVANEADEAITLLDAKRSQIFTARYVRRENRWNEAEPPHLDTLAAMLGRAGSNVALIGEGIPLHPVPPELAERTRIIPEDRWRARAWIVAQLGYAMARRAEFADPLTLTPLYIRQSEAEEKWQRDQTNPPPSSSGT